MELYDIKPFFMKQPQTGTFKIAILRALQLGDLLCAIPAIRSLRAAYPNAEITLLGLPWAASLVERFNNYFDRFIHFPGFPGLPEQPYSVEEWVKFIQRMHEEEFDLLIQMQGNGTIVNEFLPSFKAKQAAGFYPTDNPINSGLFIEYPDGISEIRRHLLLMENMDVPPEGEHLEFPITEKDEEDFKKLLLPITNKKYVVVHPGARGAIRQWSPVYFAALADYCIEQGYTVVITGVKDEIDITAELRKCMRHAAIDLTGKTSLGAIALLIKNAFMLISNCTGVSHIASAFETPSVVVSMDGEPERWAPLNKKLHHVIDWTRQPHFEMVFKETVNQIKDLSEPVFTSKVSVQKHNYRVNYFYS
jgi:ADP-heptose:LPS heptosyltransferase